MLLLGVPVLVAAGWFGIDWIYGNNPPEWLVKLGSADPSWLAAAWCLVAICPLATAYEWCILAGLASRMSLGVIAGLTYGSAMLQNAAHIVAAHGYSLHQLVRRARVAPATAVCVVALDQLADGFAKLIFFATALVIVPPPDWAWQGLGWLALVVGVTYALLLALSRWTLAPTARLTDAFSRVRDVRVLAAATGLALAKLWLIVAAALCVRTALAIELPWQAVYLFVAAVSLAKALPLLPGDLGAYEGVAWLVFTQFGASVETALLLGAVIHAVVWTAMVLPGALVLVLRAVEPAALDQPPVESISVPADDSKRRAA